MEDIWEKFDGMVRARLPLYETEVRGVDIAHAHGRFAVLVAG